MNARVLAGVLIIAAGAGAWYWFTRTPTADPAAPAGTDADSTDDPAREELAARAAVRNLPNDPQARLRLARALRLLG